MKNYKSFFKLTLAIIAVTVFTACEGEEESISLTPGTELLISGSDEILTYAPTQYFVRGHSIDEDYTWSIEGPGTATATEVVGREGEFVEVLVEDIGTYDVIVASSNGLEGSFTIEVEDVNEFIGVGSDTLNIFEEDYLEGADTLFFPIQISQRNVDSTAVEFEIVDGTAEEGVDFEVLNESNVLGFSPGDTEAYISILTTDNNLVDGPKQFRIVLGEILITGEKSSAVNQAPDSLEIGEAVVIINDDIKTVDLIVDFAEVEVEEAGNYYIDLALNRAVDEDVTIQYSIDGLPFGSDADKTNGSVTIFAGNTDGQIVLDIDPAWLEVGEDELVLELELDNIISDDDEVTLGATIEYTITVVPEEEEE